MFDVVSIGSATLDVFLRAKGLEIEKEDSTLEICMPHGAKLEVDEIHFESGGGGTNTAVTFARQGLKAACLVQIGDDLGGKKVREDLGEEGVDTSLLVEEMGGGTDYSTILWAPDGERTILVYRGETRLEVKEVDWEKIKTEWFYISSIEGNLEMVERVQGAKKVKVAWNPGKKELAQREKMMRLLPKIEVLNLNREEMQRLLGIRDIRETLPGGPPAGRQGRQVGGIKGLLKKAQELPCRHVVVTDSQNGSCLWDGRAWLHAGIYKDAPRIETTGAGDAFGSGLVTGLIRGLSLKDCLCLASANASSVVGQIGGKKGILRKGEVKEWMKKRLEIEKVKT